MNRRKRQKTDPSPVKSEKTLFHFFSKPVSNGNGLSGGFESPPKTGSDTSSVSDEPRRKSDLPTFNVATVEVKTEMTPPRMSMDEQPMECESKPMDFQALFTEANDSCSPVKEEQDDIDPFDNLDFRDDEYRDEDFPDEELDLIYENDSIEDDSDSKPTLKQESSIIKQEQDPIIDTDTDPTCPFCNFSFKGLSENVLPSPYLPYTS
jgi:hypothetical protein